MTVQEQFVLVTQPKRGRQRAGSLLRRFSVREYHWLIEHNFFTGDDHLELIDGYLVEMSPIRPPHAFCVGQLYEALVRQLGDRASVRSQQPVTLVEQHSEPEPDLVVATPPASRYSRRHPGAEDILLAVEVADATLASDRTTKLHLYAQVAIPEYWIINLGARVVEVHRQPQRVGTNMTYREQVQIGAEQQLAPQAFPDCVIELTQIFPEQGPIRL